MSKTITEFADEIASKRRSISAAQAETAISAARRAVEADRRGDCATRDRAIQTMFGAVGYWMSPRPMSCSEFRGDTIPPKMIRLPAGRSVDWTKRFVAAEAWAKHI